MSARPPKTRDELALGVLNPKTGKRRGGYVNMYRAQKQWQEALTSGDKSEEDLIEAAFEYADKIIDKRSGETGEQSEIALAAEDLEWRGDQEARYRIQYEWNDANDEASLQMLLDLEMHLRSLNRALLDVRNIKDRVELTKELRNFAKDHVDIQKKLGVDRVSRENRRRDEDPMTALREQIKLGADYVRKLREEWSSVADEVVSIDELVARAQHHSGLPQDWIQATLRAHARLLGVDSTGVDAQ